jgi:hypothetical protein
MCNWIDNRGCHLQGYDRNGTREDREDGFEDGFPPRGLAWRRSGSHFGFCHRGKLLKLAINLLCGTFKDIRTAYLTCLI